MMWKKLLVSGLLLVLLFAAGGMQSYAKTGRNLEPSEKEETEFLMNDTDWSELDEFLKAVGNGRQQVSFRELVTALMHGDTHQAGSLILRLAGQAFTDEISNSSKTAAQILALGILGAVFANFSSIFPSGKMAESGGFLTYMLLFLILAAAFFNGVSVTAAALRNQTEFMRSLIPAYSMAVIWAGSPTAAAGWMEFILFLLVCVEEVYLKFLLPLSRIYILLVLVGNMMKEDMLSRMSELLEDVIRWGTRSLVGLVFGFQFIQGMILPFADSVQLAGIQKVLALIPGVGSGAGMAAKVLLGSGVLIKNAVGAAAVVVLVVISLVPVLKLLAFMLIYRISAAVLQPVADKRMVHAIAGVAQGERMLAGMAMYGIVIFALAIALICLGTNAAYMA